MSCEHKHSHVELPDCLILPDRQTQIQYVFLCLYSHFAHSYHTAIVPFAVARQFHFLFLRVDARVTFPAGAHTLMLSTASHPGYKNKGCSLGVSCMEKKSPPLLSHTPLCIWTLQSGGLHMKGSKPNYWKCVWNFHGKLIRLFSKALPNS